MSEVIRVPVVARVPQSPPALLGFANLRGVVIPVIGLRPLLGKLAATTNSDTRAIVLGVGFAAALVVDGVDTLVTVSSEQVETGKNEISAEGAERLAGAFSIGPNQENQEVAKILDIRALLQTAFANAVRATARTARTEPDLYAPRGSAPAVDHESIVTFDVAGQEFALPLTVVQEILPLPSQVIAVARAEAAIVGVIAVRNMLLPLLSSRVLLGFAARQHSAADLQKVVVTKVAGTQIGLVVDQARAIVNAESDLIDPIPSILAARMGGESRIKSIYRGEAGRRLVSILAPEQMFREDVMQRLTMSRTDQRLSEVTTHNQNGSELVCLVFRLGDDEFGLPIDAVVEVAHVPQQITRVPKTPKFLEGVINLRGDVLPVIDQRRRFDMPKLDEQQGRKLVVIRTNSHRAALIVDSISDVLRTSAENVAPPPDLTGEVTRVVRGVISLDTQNRIVLLLDPNELLTGAEQRVLDAFKPSAKKANA